MTKQELITQLTDRITLAHESQGDYEKQHGEWVAKFGDNHSIYSEMADWSKGRALAYTHALELVLELESA